MSEPSSVTARMKRRAVAATLTAGLIAGILDITAAFLVYGSFGAQPAQILQGIASGILGPSAYDGGSKTAVLGLALHFVIALGAAAVFYAASRKLKFLTRHAVVSGFICLASRCTFSCNMSSCLCPRFTRARSQYRLMFIGIVIHMFCVGLPISLTTRRFPV